MTLEQAARLGIAAAGLVLPVGIARAQTTDAVTPTAVLADQLRSQGYPCTRTLGAQRESDKSTRDETVWILKCTDGTYRVRLVPDMAAKVEKID